MFCLLCFKAAIFKAANVPIIVAITAEKVARIKELKKAVKITLSLKSSTNQFRVNLLKTVLDFVLLKAKAITTAIGKYKNKKTKTKQILEKTFFVICSNSLFLFC